MISLVESAKPPLSQSLDVVFMTSAGLLILLIGSWIPDPRLNVSGLPAGLVLMVVAAIFVRLCKLDTNVLISCLLLQLPLLLIGFTLIWSPDTAYGLSKYSTLLVSANVVFLLFAKSVERIGLEGFCKIIVLCFLVLLLLALAYKLQRGFFDRRTPFLFSGPIVFARLMTIGAICSIVAFRGWLRFVAICVFFAAVVWAQSKGPLLGLMAALTALVFFRLSGPQKLGFFLLIFALILGLVLLAVAEVIDPMAIGRMGVILTLLAGDTASLADASNQGSLGIRIDMWVQSLDLIARNPLGVGLGGWGDAVLFYGELEYPHNLFLELWSEGGIIFGTLALVPFLVFLAYPKSPFWYIALALLVSQFVSGDLSDGRFLLLFSLLTVAFSMQQEKIPGGISVDDSKSGSRSDQLPLQVGKA